MTDLIADAATGATVSRPHYPFEVKSRDVFRIAIPASIAFITEPLVGLVDITAIGRLGDAGLLGGLVLGALVFDTIFSLAYFLRLGTAGLTAQAIGARDPRDALMHVSRAILVAVIFGVLLIALTQPLLWASNTVLAPDPSVKAALATYFAVRILGAPFSLINYALLGWFYGRANARTGMALQILIHGVNIGLNIVFVFGLGWGVAGTAAATVCGNAAAALVGMYVLARHFGGVRKLVGLIVPAELFDAAALRRMFSLSRDITIRSIALMASYAYFAAVGSRAGEVVLSGNALLMNFMMVSSFFLDGVAQASEQLCGKAVGANWRPAFDGAVRLAMIWAMLIALAVASIWMIGGQALIEVMSTNADVRTHAETYLPMVALAAVTGAPAFVMDGVLAGATLNTLMRNGMLLALAVYLLVAPLLQHAWGNTGLWLAIQLFLVLRGGIFFAGMQRRKVGLFN
jgi:MATE family multidrug resistance protein